MMYLGVYGSSFMLAADDGICVKEYVNQSNDHVGGIGDKTIIPQ